jgi:hypothetical protein
LESPAIICIRNCNLLGFDYFGCLINWKQRIMSFSGLSRVKYDRPGRARSGWPGSNPTTPEFKTTTPALL